VTGGRAAVYGGYTQSELDAQYEQRTLVPHVDDYVARWRRLSEQARADSRCRTGVAYGAGRAERLDIFMPPAGDGAAPVHVHFHGGAWRALSKDEVAYPAPLFTTRGALYIAAGFPLATAAPLAEMVASARRALAWVHHHIGKFGGNPQRLFISGFSSGGQLMPPIMGASAFLMAEFLQVPYVDVVLAALIPALLYFTALFIQADLRAARDGIAAVAAAEIPRLRDVLRRGWMFPVPFVVLIYALFGLNYGAAEAGLLTAGATVAVGALLVGGSERLRPGTLVRTLRDVGMASLDILLITAAAGIIIGVLNVSGLGFGLTLVLTDLAQHHLALLLGVAALISIILGMGMPTIGVYVLLAALVAPALVKLGIPDIAAHLFVLYFGMLSMITPPVAIAAFAAASLGGAGAMGTALESMRFGWPAYVVPFLFVFSPPLLMDAAPWRVALAAGAAGAGVWLVSAGLVGYLRRALDPPARAGLMAAGLVIMLVGAVPGYLIPT